MIGHLFTLICLQATLCPFQPGLRLKPEAERLHEDPQEEMKEAAIHQPYQCALQLIDSGKSVEKGDFVNFVKVRPFIHRGRTFTVKPIERVKSVREVNVEDYVRNLRTALNQTFKPMDIRFREEAEEKIILSDFI